MDILASMVLNCRNNLHGGCLYNVEEDPSEYNDLAGTETVLLTEMKSRLTALSEAVYVQTPHGMDSCPDDIEDDFCGCWMAQNNYDFAVGPYQDLSDFQKNFLRIHEEDIARDGHEREREVHLYIILIIIVCSVVIVFSSMYYCYRWDRRIERNKKLGPEKEPLLSEYGAVDVTTAMRTVPEEEVVHEEEPCGPRSEYAHAQIDHLDDTQAIDGRLIGHRMTI